MIKSLRLQNFQSHKDTLLTFTPGVNIIIGSSDVGKSSVVRSLRWLLHNRPAGDEFVSHNETVTSVTLELNNGTISRVKSKSGKNNYVLNKEELVGFGQDVPEEVKQLANMNELNIQYQLDPPFLLSESSGAVAKILNKIINLDIIDIGLANARRLESGVKGRLVEAKERLGKLEEELKSAPDFAYLDTELIELSKANSELSEKRTLLHKLLSLSQEILECEEELASLSIPKIEFDEVDAKLYELIECKNALKNLANVITSIQHQEIELSVLESEYTECQNKLKLLCPSRCPFCDQPITPTLLFGVKPAGEDAQKENAGRNTAQRRASQKQRIRKSGR